MTEKLQNFIKQLKPKSAPSYNANINRYLKWRKISLDQLIENDLNEEEYFKKFRTDSKIPLKESSKKIILSMVKTFLIYCGVPFRKSYKEKQPLPYHDDKNIDEFVTHIRTMKKIEIDGEEVMVVKNEGTIANAVRQIAKWCKYRNMTPTELIEELKTIQLKQLKLKIKLFYDTLTIDTKYYTISTIVRFYRIVGEVHIEMENSTKVKPKTQMQLDKTLVDKDLVRKLLEFTDLRDSMILMTCFDSGMWGVDTVGLNYGDLSEYINLENPKDVKNDVAVILVKRAKTGYQQLAGFGKQTLYYIGKWLNYRIKNGETITKESPIYTMKDFPFQRLKNKSISPIIVRLCENAGLDKHLTTSDFRNSFNTRIDDDTRMPNATKEFFMGHQSIERSYKITKLPKYIEQYHEVWEMLFDLETDHEKYKSLEDENVQLRRKLKNIETEQSDLKLVVEKLAEAFNASVGEQTRMTYQQEEAEAMYDDQEIKKEIIKKTKPISDEIHRKRQRIIKEHNLKLLSIKAKNEGKKFKKIIIEEQEFLVGED